MSSNTKTRKKVNPFDKYQSIANYVHLKYDARYNELRMVTELLDHDSGNYMELSEYRYNSLFIELQANGFQVSDRVLRKVLTSNLIPKVNPLLEYFESLPTWDGHDYIADLASTITVDDINNDISDAAELWKKLLTKFIVSIVATATTRSPGQLCLVLAGNQGIGKSTWLNNLLPPTLRENYLATGGIIPKITEKNTADLLSEKMVINLDDQIDSFTYKEYEGIKSIITSTKITSRKNYQINDSNRLRRATLVASTNHPSFLVDTSNRRYIIFTAKEIDHQDNVDRDKVFAQAYYLLQKRFPYWLNSEEQKELNDINSQYRIAPTEEELVEKYLSPGAEDKLGTEWLMTTEIKSFLELQSGNKNLYPKGLTKALRAEGFVQKSIRINGSKPRYRWAIIKNLL